MKPSVGRIVHFITPLGEHFAAIVTWVNDDETVDLSVLVPGNEQMKVIAYVVEGTDKETWHWPERE